MKSYDWIQNLFGSGFWQSLAANVAFVVLVMLLGCLSKKYLNTFFEGHPKWNRVRMFFILFLWIIANYFYSFYSMPYISIFILVTSLTVSFFIYKEMAQFWNGGVLCLDQTIAKGFDFTKALRLCTNQLDFLGIGAWKLTTNPEFENAIRRCNRPNIPIRFLLTKPDNPLLAAAAIQKGVGSQEYQRRVTESLRILATLKEEKELNIEVRFYPKEKKRDLPLFRLMFINNSILLFSYHVFGEGDGTQTPQLHLERFQEKRDVDSFYYPFRVYFDRLWDDSQPWDFKFPIT